jgi:hypothetical protein
VALLHASGKSFVVGAGKDVGNGGDDWSWMDKWSLTKRGPVEQGADEAAPPKLKGDALLVEKTESASALVYFDGKTYAWYQQGD